MDRRTMTGLLKINSTNPRYFVNASDGKSIYLTGTHTWNNFQDKGNPLSTFDYDGYLNFLTANHMNFIRMWAWENPRWGPWSSDDNYRCEPMVYKRTGPGNALDGLPKFDLNHWNDEYFSRLSERVEKAWERGIYVGIMMFSGCSIGNRDWPETDSKTGQACKNPWDSHPYNSANNINGIDGDLGKTGQGWDIRTLKYPLILSRQKAYIRKVVDTVNHFDNVLYEIANEDPYDTRDWQYVMIEYIKEYESGKEKSHPVGMSASWEQPNDALYESPADWISPYYNEDKAVSPITAFGDKVWIADSDHVFPNMGVTMDFTWKAFARGANVISMDNRKIGEAWEYFVKKAGGNILKFEKYRTESLSDCVFEAEPGDIAQKHTRMYSKRMDMNRAKPHNELSSTGYCLADPRNEYLVYQPDSGTFTINLDGIRGEFESEWFNPVTGEVFHDGTVEGGDENTTFNPAFSPSVLYLKIKAGI